MMTDSEFRKLVKELRTAQKAYFKNRLQRDLFQSKELEKKVDAELTSEPEKPAGPTQERLFGDMQ